MMSTATFLRASLAACLLALALAGCATTSSHEAQLRAAGVQAFGTDANLKVHNVFYGGPGNSMSDGMDMDADQRALIADMRAAKSHPVDLVVSSQSSRLAAGMLWAALHNPAVRSGMGQLRLLFVGNQEDADRLKPVVEATGAKFFFQQKS
jgi:Spy/CpxP family protein refolding chaperone